MPQQLIELESALGRGDPVENTGAFILDIERRLWGREG